MKSPVSRVEQIIGVSEEKLVAMTREEREKFMCNGYFVHEGDNHVTSAGMFRTMSMAELEKASCRKSDDNACELIILEGVDIGVIMSKIKTSDKAMVQVASNFNCLEVPSRTSLPNSGHLVDNAHMDSTQGPAASFGPLSAYLYRAHFHEPVDLLEDVHEYFGIPENGKLTLRGCETPIEGDNTAAVMADVRCGLHTDVPVLYGRDEEGRHFELDEPYPVIDQVFSSSINVSDYGKKTSPGQVASITNTLLYATYHCAYLAAIYRRRKVLYLTFIGGGVFGNPMFAIIKSMLYAHKTWVGKSMLKKVYICFYGKCSAELLEVITTLSADQSETWRR